MKKILSALTCFIIVLSLFSCSGRNIKDGENDHTSDDPISSDEKNEAEIAMEMYEAAVNDEICVFDEHLGEIKLKACRFPGNNLRLDESIIDGKVIFDIDRDGVNEYIIESYTHDSIVLHYYDGKVYSFSFDFEAFNNLKKDGSFYWHGPIIKGASPFSGIFNSGARRLSFDGTEIIFEDIYKTVYDENLNAKYYIGDKEVTHDAMTEYLEDIQSEFVEETPFEAPWYKVIPLEEALRIASEYWDFKPGDVDPETGFPFAILPKNSDTAKYCIALAWLVENHHYSTLEMIKIDAFTGEVIAPNYESDGK